MEPADFQALDDMELFRSFGLVMEELRRRELTRSANNPVADYAELLVARHFETTPVAGVQRGYDVLTEQHGRIQVKARRRTPRSKPSHFGWMYRLEDREFDSLAVVLFDEDFRVIEADLFTWEAIQEFARWSDRVGAHRIALVKPHMRTARGAQRLELDAEGRGEESS